MSDHNCTATQRIYLYVLAAVAAAVLTFAVELDRTGRILAATVCIAAAGRAVQARIHLLLHHAPNRPAGDAR